MSLSQALNQFAQNLGRYRMSRLMPSAGMLDIGYVALFAYREGIRTKIGSVRDVRSRGGFVIFR